MELLVSFHIYLVGKVIIESRTIKYEKNKNKYLKFFAKHTIFKKVF